MGRLVATGLLNEDMPLIRYEVGDRVRVAASSECECGRTLPVVDQIEGRTSDLIETADGRKVFWLNPVFYGLPVRQAQIVQTTQTDLLIRVVPDSEFGPTTVRTIEGRLKERVGSGMSVCIESVGEIACEPSGKRRAVVSLLTGPSAS